MKKIKALILLPFLLLCLCLSNCRSYKSAEQSSADYDAMKTILADKPIVFVQNNYSSAMYFLDGFTIADSIFSGNARFTTGLHKIDKKRFTVKISKEKEYNIDPLQSIHIVLKSDSMINEGDFETSLSNIESLVIHEGVEPPSRPARSREAKTVGWVFGGIGIAIGVAAVIFLLTIP